MADLNLLNFFIKKYKDEFDASKEEGNLAETVISGTLYRIALNALIHYTRDKNVKEAITAKIDRELEKGSELYNHIYHYYVNAMTTCMYYYTWKGDEGTVETLRKTEEFLVRIMFFLKDNYGIIEKEDLKDILKITFRLFEPNPQISQKQQNFNNLVDCAFNELFPESLA